MAETKRTAIIDKNGGNKLASIVATVSDPTKNGLVLVNPDGSSFGPYLKLNQSTTQTITGGIPLLTGLTPTTDYQIATKKYVDDNISIGDWSFNGDTLGAKKTLGSIDNYDIGFITNNTERMTIDKTGNIGVGVNPDSTIRMFYESPTIATTGFGTTLYVREPIRAVTVAESNYFTTSQIDSNAYNIASGITDSGYRYGLQIAGAAYENNFKGTLAYQAGIRILHGIIHSDPTAVITNSYGLYIESPTTDGTVTNLYSIYQATATATNYFAGLIQSASTITGTRFISNIADGTAPYSTTSTTLNTNLNADLLDGVHGSGYLLTTGATTGATSQAQVFTNGVTANGNVNITKVDPELRLTDTGNSEYTRITRTDTNNLAVQYNRALTAGTSLTPDYANPGGTGDRRSTITVTASPGFFAGTLSYLVDGSLIDNQVYFATNGEDCTGKYLRWDFGTSVLITEMKWYQEPYYGTATWQIQGSDDAISWTDIGATFQITASPSQTITTPSGNTTNYRYYQWLGISGNVNRAAYLHEMQFKIGLSGSGTMDETIVWSSKDGLVPTEKSVNTFGDPTGTSRTVIDGYQIRFNTGGTHRMGIANAGYLYGGTLTTEGLTLRANSANTTTGTISITTSTGSTSTTTGALTVAGGVGIAENLYVGGATGLVFSQSGNAINQAANYTEFNVANGKVGYLSYNGVTKIVWGGGTPIYLSNGVVIVGDTTESSSSITGCMTLAGGLGIAKNLYIGGTGSINVANGGITVSGYNTVNTYQVAATITQCATYYPQGDYDLTLGTRSGVGNKSIIFKSTGTTPTESWRMDLLGNLTNTGGTGTAYLHLKAGTATAGTAPLKFTSGTLLGTAEAGAIEFLTDKFYATISTGPTRKEIVTTDNPITTTSQIQFRDSAIHIASGTDGWLNLTADTGVEVNAPILNASSVYSTGGFDCGDAGGFSGMKFNASTTQLEVWIDGAKIGHFATDGTYNDDV